MFCLSDHFIIREKWFIRTDVAARSPSTTPSISTQEYLDPLELVIFHNLIRF